VNRDAFIRDLRHYCRKNGLAFEWKAVRGKGGHGLVTVAGKTTTVQSSLKPGRIESILKQLGLPKDAV
jgi:predicted RNA binding protein YcfA (HicA-like mRNA interferase family)